MDQLHRCGCITFWKKICPALKVVFIVVDVNIVVVIVVGVVVVAGDQLGTIPLLWMHHSL